MGTLISIVFLNYNRLSETKKTVNKLLQCKNQLDYIEIIAVDNGSTDGTRQYLSELGESIRTVLLDRNYGIEGYNRGFELSQGDVIIVLDDDSHIDTNTIERARETFSKEHNLGILAFKIVNENGERFNTWHVPAQDKYQESFAFVGCGFAIRKNIFKEIGFYPREFFLYHNEIAVAINVKLLGYKIIFDPLCIAIHRTGGQQRDPSRRIYYTLKNSLVLIWTYYPFHIAWYMTISRIIISSSLALIYLRGKEVIRALLDFLSSRPKRILLAKKERMLLKPFFYQNSIFHRIFF
jgi:GT2 family glycosyltransferase